MSTTVTTPNEVEIRVERIFDAPRAHVYSIWTDPQLIPEWWGDGTVVEEMDVRPGGTWRFRTAYGVVGRAARAPRSDVPEPSADARVRGSRRADEADADDALRDDRATRHHDAVRRRGGREAGLRTHRRAAREDRGMRRRVDSSDHTEVDCWGAALLWFAEASQDERAGSVQSAQAPRRTTSWPATE